MQLRTLHLLLVDELQELYIAESMIEEAIGRLRMGVSATEFQQALQKHGEETKEHIHRLELIFRKLEMSPRGGHALSVKALLREGEDRLGIGGDPHVVDGAVIASVRRVEHWEIASYTTLQIYAERLDLTEIAELLGKTLEEEKSADARMDELARQLVLKGDKEA